MNDPFDLRHFLDAHGLRPFDPHETAICMAAAFGLAAVALKVIYYFTA